MADFRAPRSFGEKGLARSGIEALDRVGWYRCLSCGRPWSPCVQPGGRYPRGWWHCPGGCNRPGATDAGGDVNG
jgi:hypothetical protein